MKRSPVSIRHALGLLALAAAVGADAATVRVRGNQTSDVIATGKTIDGGHFGDRTTEHPGDTGAVDTSSGSASLSQLLIASSSQASASLLLSGHASLGDLGISGEATASIGEPDGIGASAYGGIRAEWRAQLTLLSDSLPTGTPVDLKALLVVQGSGLLQNETGGHNRLTARYRFPNLGPGKDFQCADFTGGCSFAETVALSGHVGVTYSLSGELDLGVTASTSLYADPKVLSNLAVVEAGNSAHLYLEVLTPGVRYVFDDGTVLPTAPPMPVPEPAAALLWLAGLGVVVTARRAARRT
jgi:hypothetical protein